MFDVDLFLQINGIIIMKTGDQLIGTSLFGNRGEKSREWWTKDFLYRRVRTYYVAQQLHMSTWQRVQNQYALWSSILGRTDGQTDDGRQRLMPPLWGRGIISGSAVYHRTRFQRMSRSFFVGNTRNLSVIFSCTSVIVFCFQTTEISSTQNAAKRT